MDRETRQAIRSLQEQINRVASYNPVQLASGGNEWEEVVDRIHLCKITVDNADGTYTIHEWDTSGAGSSTGWAQSSVKIWESPNVDFWAGEGVDKYVLAVEHLGDWWISLGWANITPGSP